jgi:hypothetical protein
MNINRILRAVGWIVLGLGSMLVALLVWALYYYRPTFEWTSN